MQDLLNSDKLQNTKVTKYQFNKLDIGESEELEFNNQLFSTESIKTDKEENIQEVKKFDENNSELLDEIDALASEIVNLQMEMQTDKKDFEQQLEDEKKTQFDLGKKEGIVQTCKSIQDESDDLKIQLIKSITTLDKQKSSFDNKFKEIEESLIESAIIIAKKVIKKEIENDSAKIAKNIASSLVSSIKDASLITIKVNKNDFLSLSEQFNQDSIKIEADDAIGPGGVVILNNDTNIDATINTRLNQALNLIGKE